MEKVFAICISQKDKEDYSIALPLEEIDDKFITLGKEGVLQKIREYDSVMQEKDPSKLAIKVLGKNNKLYEDRYIQIVTDPVYQSFPIAPILDDALDGFSNTNILKNRLLPYLKRNISSNFAMMIEKLNSDKQYFIDNFMSLSYDEQRIVRGILLQNIYIFKYVKKEEKPLTLNKKRND